MDHFYPLALGKIPQQPGFHFLLWRTAPEYADRVYAGDQQGKPDHGFCRVGITTPDVGKKE
jgi:hypothetical protein